MKQQKHYNYSTETNINLVSNKTFAGKNEVVFRNLITGISSTTYGAFALYKYPAKFIPQVIAYSLMKYGHPGMSVIDPFAGYGTVGIVARLCGFDYELWDLNPLLEHLHKVAIMPPLDVDLDDIVDNMKMYSKPFIPDWSNLNYWFSDQFLPVISNAWGYYHSLEDEELQRLLLIPLLKTTRYFSFNDTKTQSLCKSHYAKIRIQQLLEDNWQETFYSMILKHLKQVLNGLKENQSLKPKSVNYTIKAGIDSSATDLEQNRDILLTSPPYLQAQEYIRATKMDLYWLGYSENKIKELGRLEFPYKNTQKIDIYSETYEKYLSDIEEPRMIKIYENYFHGVLGTLSRLQEKITDKLLLFVGSATIRTVPIPIDQIFIEHFTNLGWKYQATLVDTIVSRNLPPSKINPATGKKDVRMSTEQLVVLSRT